MHSVWCQDPVIAYTVHASIPPIVVVAQVAESSAAMAEAVAGTVHNAGVADIVVVVANITVDIADPSEDANILA